MKNKYKKMKKLTAKSNHRTNFYLQAHQKEGIHRIYLLIKSYWIMINLLLLKNRFHINNNMIMIH
jgi:hypothetical protein